MDGIANDPIILRTDETWVSKAGPPIGNRSRVASKFSKYHDIRKHVDISTKLCRRRI